MKRTFTFSLALLIGTAWFAMSFAGSHAGEPFTGKVPDSHQERMIQPGERPPVDLREVSDDAFEPGKILVRFRPSMDGVLDQGLFVSKSGQSVAIDHPAVDQVNQQFDIRQYKPLLFELYQRPDKTNLRTDRHRAWGFHLWYELTLGDEADVRDAVRAFSGLDEVEVAEPVYRKVRVEPAAVRPVSEEDLSALKWSPDDQYYGLQWGFKNTGQDIRGTFGTPGADISAEAAWDVIKGNPEVVVAVIDGGVQYNHPDLQANMWPGIGPDGTSTTPDDHGTHVAGTIAAVSQNSVGVAGTAGGDGSSNSGVKVMSLDIFGGSHGMNNLQLNVYAADNGAAISQNSWGYMSANVYNQVDLDGIDYFNANGGGTILDGGLTIFAAGNDNDNGQWYPACYPATLAVASTDNKDIKSSFSNYGSWVDLAAPGTDIASTASGSSYVWMSGTSMACPHVSGVAALVLSYAPGVMTNQQLWDLLVANTDNIDATNPAYTGSLGSGRLNALKAVQAAGAFVGGITPPASLSAAAVNESEIGLQWQPNAGNDPVLVAWSANGTFGTPANGTIYSAGQTIAGGGTVLVAGSALTSYQHTGLDFAQTYYYRAWSYNSGEYSAPRSAQATTLCPDAYSLPFTEDFNSSASTPLCWSNAGTANWSFGAFSNGLTGTSGNYAYAEFSGNVAQNARLISPSFDFSGVTDVRLQFSHRYNHEKSTATLSYSLNGGSSWTTIQSWAGNTGTVAFDQVITALAGQTGVQFLWELNFAGGGPPVRTRSWSIDDVAISGASAGVSYTITASAGTGGSISPSGDVSVQEGNNQSFTITPGAGFEIASVVVDGNNMGSVNNYTFTNVTADHTIHATFNEVPVVMYTITASAGTGGSISPSGDVSVQEGNNQSFAIAPDAGYVIADVVVDGGSVGAVNNYTFTNVMADHTIHATFSTAPEDPCLVSNLPYIQNFDATANIPDCWSDVVHAGNTSWVVGTGGNLSGTTGNQAYFVHTGNQIQEADLVSLPFDFSGYSGISLSFKHRYVHDRSTASVSYSVDGGNSWVLIQTFSSSTANPSTFSQSLAALAGQPNVRFRWKMNFTGGGSVRNSRSWSVDDIQVTAASATQAQAGGNAIVLQDNQVFDENLTLMTYPNPTSGRLHLQFNNDIDDGVFAVYDLQGRQLLSGAITSLKAGSHVELQLDGFVKGMYLVRVIAGNAVVSSMISKD